MHCKVYVHPSIHLLFVGNISCNIPAVKPMETTSIACKFPKDISLSKTDFSIHHVNITKPGNIDDTIFNQPIRSEAS